MSKRRKWDTSVWGLSVIATDEAVEQGILHEGQRGILLGFSNDTWKVIKEGTTTTAQYHKDFWMLRALAKG